MREGGEIRLLLALARFNPTCRVPPVLFWQGESDAAVEDLVKDADRNA